MLFAGNEIKLSKKQEDGQPLRSHLLSVEKQTGEKLIEIIECPDCLYYLWLHFVQIKNHCREEYIGFEYLESWCNVMKTELNYTEVTIILMLDGLVKNDR